MGVNQGHKSTACEVCYHPAFQQSINEPYQQRTLAAARPTQHFGAISALLPTRPGPYFRNNRYWIMEVFVTLLVIDAGCEFFLTYN
jgi:hypothetical protein